MKDCEDENCYAYNSGKKLNCGAAFVMPEHCASYIYAQKDAVAKSPAAMAGSDARFKPASDYTDEGLVQLALEVYARAASYMIKELHDRAMEAKQELLKRLKERH